MAHRPLGGLTGSDLKPAMYQYTEFDKQFVQLRAQQFRDQLERWQKGELTDEQMLPLRLQNGWYIQRYAPMALSLIHI